MLRRSLHSGDRLWVLLALLVGCSTQLSPYSQIEDDPDESAEGSLDAGAAATDAGSRKDAGSRDASVSTQRDAGQIGSTKLCMRVPDNGVASLLNDDCAMRAARSCVASGQTPQQVVNQRLADIAKKCASPSTATIGVIFNALGCPTELRYSDRRVAGAVSFCMQALLESERVACALSCALIGPGATIELN